MTELEQAEKTLDLYRKLLKSADELFGALSPESQNLSAKLDIANQMRLNTLPGLIRIVLIAEDIR